MKKIKRVLICLILLLFPLCAFACDNGKDKPVKIESIELNSYNVTLRPSESFDLTLTYSPSKVDDDTINYMLTDSSVVNVEKIDNLNYKLTAKSNVSGTLSTYIQFTSEDGNAKSEVCKITVYTEITQLFAPTKTLILPGTATVASLKFILFILYR